jgi:hypothetical protein
LLISKSQQLAKAIESKFVARLLTRSLKCKCNYPSSPTHFPRSSLLL